uniref:Reverse transcriptase Ty1/copia-type domain-containing protein n=1 Tax=Peronospora matthiolae TaxID=2874970 RepID=A0AAV1URM1_9STRA
MVIRTIGYRCFFAKKRDQNGRVVRFKALLVAKCFKQKNEVNLFETYSPMEQLDAETAFLNSESEDRVEMEVPLGVENTQDYVVPGKKAIYGLKQAASAWSKSIHRVILDYGLKSRGANLCFYVKRSKNSFIYVCLYVEIMIIVAKTSDKISDVKAKLKKAFKMKELRPEKFFLGMEIDHDMTIGTLMIKQTRCIDDVANWFGQETLRW